MNIENDNDVEDVEFVGCEVCGPKGCNAENEYWGVCPICHRNDGYIDYVSDSGATHVMVCDTHKTCWAFAGNLFSGWMYESPEKHRADREKLAEYTSVKPYKAYIDAIAEDISQHRIDRNCAAAQPADPRPKGGDDQQRREVTWDGRT